MPDLKLFHLSPAGHATERKPTFFTREAEVQRIVEQNMETIFGIRFLASEYSTGKKHRGRIDSLGLDENNCPVIVEYKLDSKENVINQGLFYLDWLLDHRSEFQLQCMKKFGADIEIDWSAPRLLCIARDFTRYDEYAIGQINRNIELIRYQAFGDQILFELAKTVEGDNITDTSADTGKTSTGSKYSYRTLEDALGAADADLLALLDEVDAFLLGLGEDVTSKQLKFYRAYRRLKNFACLEVKTRDRKLAVYCKAPFPDPLPPNMRDVRNIGHYGTGDLEINITNPEELEAAKALLTESYENN